MTVSSAGQLRFFFLSVLAGLISGAFYNLLRAVREKNGRGPAGPVSDLFFWIFVGAALIKLSLDFNDGGIRGYQLLGAACGFALHYLCLGQITLPLARAVVRAAAIALFPENAFPLPAKGAKKSKKITKNCSKLLYKT